ncbi:hypothetical protein GCM10011247_37490 [Pseudomonas plecoglossicida]|nr:hypothetical protein GCM10011247_37490 [Pseudomonas plecoglossicida]
MTLSVSVLGVLGGCWVGFRKPTQIQAPESVDWRECVLGVLGSRTHARRRSSSSAEIEGPINLYASPEKLNTPDTLNTDAFNPLNLLGFECVGFVLGWLNVCRVLNSEGWR